MRIYRLDNPVQRYAWGSVNGITEALGIPNPGGAPLAEVWMGAHPSAPSTVLEGESRIGLDELVRRDPAAALGAQVVERLGPSLPFLFKVLSAGSPLSIQAHPSKRKAELGFERENLASIPLDAPDRNYRDPNHKPEMVVALTRFEMICGFRPVAEIIENMRQIVPGEFERDLERLERDPGRVELSVLFYALMSTDARSRDRLLAAASGRVAAALGSGSLSASRAGALRWTQSLMDYFPGDMGALLPLMLNYLVLEPGEAAFVAPGELHAHLAGTCFEIMANSDNVLRGGLTKKHVDVAELVSVLSFNPASLVVERPSPVAPFEEAYPAYVPDFAISRIALSPGDEYRRSSPGPDILLCESGEVELGGEGEWLPLRRGESAFAAADSGLYRLRPRGSGRAVVFRAHLPNEP